MYEKHGHTSQNNGKPTPEYNSWVSMKKRCSYPKTNGYKNYGGKGIKVCERWVNSFEDFLSDMGPKPSPLHTIDRYPDKNGNYEPDNCRWATPHEQMTNQNKTTYVKYNGELVAVPTLAHKFNIPLGRLSQRIKRGWDIEKALNTPNRLDSTIKWGRFCRKTHYIKSDAIYASLKERISTHNIPIARSTTNGITRSILLARRTKAKYKANFKYLSGSENPNSKKILGRNTITNEEKIFYGLKEAADYIGAKKANVANVISGERLKTIKKWTFKHL